MSDSLTLTRESPRLAASRLPSIPCSFRAFATPILAWFVPGLSTFDGLATLCLVTDRNDELNPVRTRHGSNPGLSGKEVTSPPPPPLRTARECFHSCSSSIH